MVTRIPPVPLSPIQSGELSDGRPGRFPGHQRQCNADPAIVAGADVARRLGQGTQPARASQGQHPARATSSKPVDCLAVWESAVACEGDIYRNSRGIRLLSRISPLTRHATCRMRRDGPCRMRAARRGRARPADPARTAPPRREPRGAARATAHRRAPLLRRCSRGSIFSVIEDMLIIMTRTPHTHITHVHTTHVCYKIHICAT